MPVWFAPSCSKCRSAGFGKNEIKQDFLEIRTNMDAGARHGGVNPRSMRACLFFSDKTVPALARMLGSHCRAKSFLDQAQF